jgi:hypothetical protein
MEVVMPLTTRKKDRGNPEDVLECHTSFVQDKPDGGWVSFNKGDRIWRGDVAEKVRGYEKFFKLDGAPDPVPDIAPPPEYDDPHAAKIVQPLPDDQTVVCTTGLVTPYEGKMVAIVAGERVPKDHPLVKKHPDRFETD